MINLTSTLTEHTRTIDWPRLSYTASVASYAGAVGAAVVVVNLLSRTPIFLEPERLPLVPAVVLSSGSAMAAVFLVAPIAYWLYGDRPALDKNAHRNPLGILIWLALGVIYGVFQPLLAGGIFIPLSRLFFGFYEGMLGSVDLLNGSIDIIFSAPIRAATTGAPLLLTSLIVAPVFAAGAWAIDRMNASRNPYVSSYVSWVAGLILVGVVLGIAVFGPADLLAKLG